MYAGNLKWIYAGLGFGPPVWILQRISNIDSGACLLRFTRWKSICVIISSTILHSNKVRVRTWHCPPHSTKNSQEAANLHLNESGKGKGVCHPFSSQFRASICPGTTSCGSGFSSWCDGSGLSSAEVSLSPPLSVVDLLPPVGEARGSLGTCPHPHKHKGVLCSARFSHFVDAQKLNNDGFKQLTGHTIPFQDRRRFNPTGVPCSRLVLSSGPPLFRKNRPRKQCWPSHFWTCLASFQIEDVRAIRSFVYETKSSAVDKEQSAGVSEE